MQEFCLFVHQDSVQVARILSGDLMQILFNGENKIPLNQFWAQFKNKIEYHPDDYLALVVFTDHPEFEIDTEIQIADAFDANTNVSWLIEDYQGKYLHTFCYPEIDAHKNTKDKQQKVKYEASAMPAVKSQPKKNEEVIGSSNLQNFFRQQTRDYKRN